jgi:hypothetical protein
MAVVPRMCSMDPKRSANSSQGIHVFEVYLFFNQRNKVLLKTIVELFELAMCLFCTTITIPKRNPLHQ